LVAGVVVGGVFRGLLAVVLVGLSGAEFFLVFVGAAGVYSCGFW